MHRRRTWIGIERCHHALLIVGFGVRPIIAGSFHVIRGSHSPHRAGQALLAAGVQAARNGARSRRGCARVGYAGARLRRFRRRHRGERAGPSGSGPARGAEPAVAQAVARQQRVLHRAAAAAGRGTGAGVGVCRAGISVQLRRGGERGGDQAGAQMGGRARAAAGTARPSSPSAARSTAAPWPPSRRPRSRNTRRATSRCPAASAISTSTTWPRWKRRSPPATSPR